MKEMNRLTINGQQYRVADEWAVRFEAQSLSEEQKALARENIGAADVGSLGDVEAALDGILAIQAALMGGEEA